MTMQLDPGLDATIAKTLAGYVNNFTIGGILKW